MNRKVATWAVIAVATLGLAGCAGTPTASETPATTSQPTQESTAEQTVAEACIVAAQPLAEISTLDLNTAAQDPEGTLTTFTETVDALGVAVESVTNTEVKDAVTTVQEDFTKLRDVLQKVVVDQDMSAASDLNTIASDVNASGTELTNLCRDGS